MTICAREQKRKKKKLTVRLQQAGNLVEVHLHLSPSTDVSSLPLVTNSPPLPLTTQSRTKSSMVMPN